MELIPAIDVLEGAVVRLRQGRFDRPTVYASDPVAIGHRWLSEGASLLHVVDLAGAREGRPDYDLWERLGREGLPFQAGGGIRTRRAAERVLGCGARRVVMGSAAVASPESLRGLGESVVAAVDVRAGSVATEGWEDTGGSLEDALDGLADVGVERLLVTGISVDGTMSGPDFGLTRRVLGRGQFSVIGSGGVGSLDDLTRLAAVGCEAAVVGKALYEGVFSVTEAIDHLRIDEQSSPARWSGAGRWLQS